MVRVMSRRRSSGPHVTKVRALYVEWQARRAGRRGVHSSIHRATRDVTGPTGWVFSATWDKLDQHGEAYVRSFDPRIPPSIFVSERDRLRYNQPMPLVERCIEDHPGTRKPQAQPAPGEPASQLGQMPPVAPMSPRAQSEA